MESHDQLIIYMSIKSEDFSIAKTKASSFASKAKKMFWWATKQLSVNKEVKRMIKHPKWLSRESRYNHSKKKMINSLRIITHIDDNS